MLHCTRPPEDSRWRDRLVLAERSGIRRVICDAQRGRGAAWGPDDSIVFAPDGNTGLSQISAAGGAPRILTTLNDKAGELSHRAPQILPGGKTVLFTVFTGEALTI